MRPQCLGNLGITPAGQVDEPFIVVQLIAHHLLRAAGGLAGPGQCALTADSIEQRGFAGIGAAGECDLGADIGW